MTKEIKNARISKTHLGTEDHGIFTCFVFLDYEGSGQGFGGHQLKYKDYGVEYLRKIIEVVGVDSWEKLPGKHVRVEADHCKVRGIGNIVEDRWFYPEGKDDKARSVS